MYRKTQYLLLATLIANPLFVLAETQSPLSVAAAESASAGTRTFQSPDEATQALINAVTKNDREQLALLFGSNETDLLSSGDEVEDQNNRAYFATLAQEKQVIEKVGEDKAILHVGQSDWTFPIPLQKKGESWQFDTQQGRQEILNRRIGRNELNTLSAIRGYVEAQFDYANADRDGDGVAEYAQKLQSEPGQFDGLYWEAGEGQPQSPLGPLFAAAKAQGYQLKPGNQQPTPYHGYVYRILTRQGNNVPGGKYDYIINSNMIAGFALVAFPVHYGVSGIMTFVVNHQGKILQKDLGEKTMAVVEKMKDYNPDTSWEAALPAH